MFPKEPRESSQGASSRDISPGEIRCISGSSPQLDKEGGDIGGKMSVDFECDRRGEIVGKLEFVGAPLSMPCPCRCLARGLAERFEVWAGRELFCPVNGPAFRPGFCFGGCVIS